MDGRKYAFLKAVLGEDGAKALSKAAQRGPELEYALLPRTIMAWLGIAARADFEGQIPGVGNTYLQFAKSEDRYSGSVAVGDEVYSFDSASMLHLGACVAVALGADHERVDPSLRDLDLQRLGKNIDTLVKARIAVAELRKLRLEMTKAAKSPSGGAEPPGPAHAPTPPQAPTAPEAPQPTQTSKGPTVSVKPKLPKLPTPKAATDQVQTGPGTGAPKQPKPKSPSLKVTKAEAEAECICGGKQFKDDKFIGCVCFADLAKAVSVTVLDDGYNLTFGSSWDQEAILTLIESLGRK